MPTYAYACTECHHRFDVHQAFSDAALTECPECSGRLRKVFGAVGVVFKGSGFYRTDSRDSSGKRSSSTPTTGGAPAKGSSASSDSASASSTSSGSTSSSSGSTTSAPAPASTAATS